MKNILLLAHHDNGQDERLKAAIQLVQSLGGNLICLDLAVPAPFSDPFGGIRPVVTDAEQRSALINHRQVEEKLAIHGITADWIAAVGDPAECLVRAASLCDIIVISAAGSHGVFQNGIGLAADVVTKAARPVLAVPDTARGFDLSGHALIAWDGSRQATAAMRAAIPLLRLATAVTLLEIDDGSVEIPAEDAAVYLGRHEVVAHVHPKHLLVRTPGRMILEASRRESIDYVVMGGFGHSRMREALFGGVSETMLARSEVPVFMTHA